MKIRAAFLAAAFSLPLFAGAGLAATGTVSVVDAARLGDREAVRSALMSGANPNNAEGDDTTAASTKKRRANKVFQDVREKARMVDMVPPTGKGQGADFD